MAILETAGYDLVPTSGKPSLSKGTDDKYKTLVPPASFSP